MKTSNSSIECQVTLKKVASYFTSSLYLKADQFRCQNGEGCIYNGWLCDGDADCGDQSDENTEICSQETVEYKSR